VTQPVSLPNGTSVRVHVEQDQKDLARVDSRRASTVALPHRRGSYDDRQLGAVLTQCLVTSCGLWFYATQKPTPDHCAKCREAR
jgi:hypothetical protein